MMAQNSSQKRALPWLDRLKMSPLLRKMNSLSNSDWYIKALLFWNPLITLGFCVLSGPRGVEELLFYWIFALYIATIVTNVCWGATVLAEWANNRLAKRYPGVLAKRSIGWYFVVSFLAMPLGLYIAFASLFGWAPLLAQWNIHVNHTDWPSYRIGLVWGALITLFFFLYHTRLEAKSAVRLAEMRLQQLENQHLQAQIAALTAQMNPHLLFNALNTVAALIPTAPDKAETVLLQLAELYRGVLDSSRKMVHALATELRLCEAYLAIEHARFGDRLQWEIAIDPDLDPHTVQVPALCLQPLVENAVKHGLSSMAEPGRIVITIRRFADNLELQVVDNGVGLPAEAIASLNCTEEQNNSPVIDSRSIVIDVPSNRSSHGIQNIHERLRLHFAGQGRLKFTPHKPRGLTASLQWPLQEAPFAHARSV